MTNLQLNELSERELDILKLVATGASNKEIAQKLFISSNTVKVHLRNIFSKIKATSRTEAAMYAVRLGLVENASYQIPKQDQSVESSERGESIAGDALLLPGEKLKPNKTVRVIQYISFTIATIAFLLLGGIYIRRSILPASTPIPSTATPRVQWYALDGLSSPRQGLAAVGYENFIYAIGGDNAGGVSNAVEKYNLQSNLWTEHSAKPTAVTDINAALIGGLIYVPGGRLSSGIPTNITEVYNPELDQWTSGTPLPEPLSAYSLAVYEGKIYIFGGWDGKQITNSVYVFDPHDDSWSEAAPMPTARESAGAAVVGSKIYLIGGWDGSQSVTSCEIFRPDLINSGREWTTVTPLPIGRNGMGVTNLADMVFVVGGTEVAGDPVTIVLLPGAIEWSKIDSPVPSGWTKLSTVVIGSRLYALGGSTQQGLFTQMWSYQAIYTITLPIVR
jgi:DNA-binding CsgD family transcriptional regulator/N-acetylneuraminic acid mutarotase